MWHASAHVLSCSTKILGDCKPSLRMCYSHCSVLSVWWLPRGLVSLKVVLQYRHWGRTRVQAVNRRMLVETATVSAQLDALA